MPQESNSNSRSSSTFSTSSRGVSPVEVRRAINPLERLRNASPAKASSSKHASTSTIIPMSHPLSQSQAQEEAEEPKYLVSSQESTKSAERRSLLHTKPAGPSFKDQEEDFDVITMSFSNTSSAARSRRHSRASSKSSTVVAPADVANPPPIPTAVPSGSGRASAATSALFDGRCSTPMPGVITSSSDTSAPLKTQFRSLPGPPLDAISVAEGTNPAVYMPTKGDGFHDPHLHRIERRIDKGKGHAPQNFHFALIASNIENAFDAMR
ncbi:hypothetical protein DOTSEDRAFT_73363 [Dothistroma septosporum NZE10]|uniref:Uncharacterized protein n=1 Tax=Dothistroma septosporum (strain NZE10 / CBS 128990) TaxID=675120 RepID=N1PJB0_DOTSN|nr:hypothetical protein DOTSEDRAFT_73363 [Dothistroma septosporum NZE10]